MRSAEPNLAAPLVSLYRKDAGEEGGKHAEGDEPDPDHDEYVSAPAFDGRGTGPETTHHTLLGGVYSVGECEDQEYERTRRHCEREERTNRTSRDERRPGQTGQNRARSPEACERIAKPKYGESERRPPAALMGLEFGEGFRETRHGMKVG